MFGHVHGMNGGGFPPIGDQKLLHRPLGGGHQTDLSLVLGVIAQIAEDVQQEQHRRELHDLRNEVRSAYREAAASVQASFWEQFDRFLLDFYEPELLAIDAAAGELTGQRANRSSDTAALRTLDERAAILIDAMVGSRQLIVAT